MLGHDARLMPAKYVRPYSKGQKNDFRDAEAIAEAVQRPTMKFVATKTADQFDLEPLHRVRDRLVGQRCLALARSSRAQWWPRSARRRVLERPEVRAWLGLVPEQMLTGDRMILGSILYQGMVYLRATSVCEAVHIVAFLDILPAGVLGACARDAGTAKSLVTVMSLGLSKR
jgi:transposase